MTKQQLIMQPDAQCPDDKAFFRELEAVYLLRLLLISCSSSMEGFAYDLQDPGPALTALLQCNQAGKALMSAYNLQHAQTHVTA